MRVDRACLTRKWERGHKGGGETTRKSRRIRGKKTYNSWDSLVVTHPTTDQPDLKLKDARADGIACFLLSLWSYVLVGALKEVYIAQL